MDDLPFSEDAWRLSSDGFRDALETGLGRAVLCLRHHDAATYAEILIEGCLKDQCIDAECEDSLARNRDQALRRAVELSTLRGMVLMSSNG